MKMKMQSKPVFYILLLFVLLIFFINLVLPGCKDYNRVDLYPPCDTTQIGYAEDVQPIFEANCIPCHSEANAFGGIVLATLEGARIPASNGLLLKAVTHDPSVVPMPKGGGMLDDCSINKIRRWINLGEPAR
jgi:hypothetical protein